MLVTSVGLFGVVAVSAALPQHYPPPTTLVTATRPHDAVTTSGADWKPFVATTSTVESRTTSPTDVPTFNDYTSCVSSCIDASFVCLKTAGPEQCAHDSNHCKLDCFNANAPKPAKRQIVNTVQSPHNAACVTDCMAHYNVCLSGGHADSYCKSTADACFHQCPTPRIAPEAKLPKRQVTQETIKQCEQNCIAQWDICMAGDHTEEYCDKIAKACLAQCPEVWPKESGEQLSKRQTIPSIVIPFLQSGAQQQCVDNCAAQYKICRKGEHDDEYCLRLTRACLKQCPESTAKDLEEIENLDKRQVIDPWRQCIDNCDAQYDVCMAGLHGIDFCIDRSIACRAQCPDPTAKASEESFDIEKRQTLETTLQCNSNCLAQYEVCKKGGHTTEYCAKITEACQKKCPIAQEPKEGGEIVVIEKRQTLDITAQCILNCSKQFDTCRKGGFSFETCARLTAACQNACPGVPEPEGLTKSLTPECDQCEAGWRACWETAPEGQGQALCTSAFSDCRSKHCMTPPTSPQPEMPDTPECRKCETDWHTCQGTATDPTQSSAQCLPAFEQCLHEHCQLQLPSPPPVKRQSSTPECAQCDADWYACLETAPEWNEAQVQCVPTYQQCQLNNACPLPPFVDPPAEATVTILPVDIPTVTATPAPDNEPTKRQSEPAQCNQCDTNFYACMGTDPAQFLPASVHCVPVYFDCLFDSCPVGRPPVDGFQPPSSVPTAAPAPGSRPTKRQVETPECDQCYGDFYTCLGPQEGWTDRYPACEATYLQCMTDHCPLLANPEPWEELEDPLPPSARVVSEPVKRQNWTEECNKCYTDMLKCLDVAFVLTCNVAYEHCLEVNACSLAPPAPSPTLPAFRPEPVKRSEAKDCKQCEDELQTCIDNRAPFQPLDQTCGFPYRQCQSTCTPPPPPAPVRAKRIEAVDCGVCDRQAKSCMDSRGPAIHALDIICGIPHRQCLATCTRPHSDNGVCVKHGIEFEC